MRITFAATSLLVFAVSCTQDFGQYEPDDTSDAAAPRDATSDAKSDAGDGGCTAPQGCFDTAGSCGQQCGNQKSTCVNNCGSSNFCKQNCSNTDKSCRLDCAKTCTTCTSNAGCKAESTCGSAVN
ncbi:hypothetical protein BH09MYX1_BH09MYX1_12800 [soil metagenome]